MIARGILTIAVIVFLVCGCTNPEIGALVLAAPTPQPITFDTPEAAIEHYLEGVREANVAKILEASAVEEKAAGFRFVDNADRLQILVPASPSPADYPFFAEINAATDRAMLLNQARNFAYSLLSTEVIDGRPIVDFDAERAAAFAAEVDPARLASIEVKAIEDPLDSFGGDATRARENFTKLAAIYGADELAERSVIFTFEGRNYASGFSLIRYGDSWKVSAMASILAGTSVLGIAEESTP